MLLSLRFGQAEDMYMLYSAHDGAIALGYNDDSQDNQRRLVNHLHEYHSSFG